jgi:multicomponent Na+:H+ antiporter subunit A
MTALLLLHGVAAVLAPVLVHRWGRRAFPALAVPPLAAAVWAATATGTVAGGGVRTEDAAWVPSLGLALAFRLDVLAWLLVLLVGGVGALVLLYCRWYFDDDEPGLGRFAGYLTAFAGAMLGLVVSDNMLALYLFWELTTILSYLLIGHRTASRTSRGAAATALVVTTAGGLAMLVGIVLLAHEAGSYRLSDVVAARLDGPVVTTAVVLVLVGAVSKSALVPFHFWLPAAMAAPTPVSAYLHAAAMVKAGVYLVARLAPGFAHLPAWRALLMVLGGATMLLGGWRALRQHDLKLLLAYGTVAQLGFLVLLLGTGTRDAALAGLALLLAHALFKSSLFLVVGVVDHSAGTRDLRELSGLGRRMPVLAGAAVLAAASMAGVPPALGFVAKEAALTGYTDGDGAPGGAAVAAVLVAGSVLTVAYAARFLGGAFGTRSGAPDTPLHRPAAGFVTVPALLALAGIVAGVTSTAVEPLLARYATAWPADGHPAHLGLWHGVNLPLLLSVVTLCGGLALYATRTRVEAVQAAVPAVGDAARAYQRLLRLTDRSSLELTARIQRGSLPLTLGAVLVVLVALPGGSLLLGATWPAAVRWDTPAQLAVAVVTAVAALAATRSRRRLRAAVLVGVTGYGVAVLFLLHGAPDLALTQILVETVSLVLFVLVLRRLPSRFWDTPPGVGRWARGLLGTAVGVVVTGLAVTAASARTARPASVGMPDAARDFGGGTNIVNVILVDLRAWDTMGELSVILATATGVASLVFLRERNLVRVRQQLRDARAQPRVAVSTPERQRWLARTTRTAESSVVFEVVTRLVFHSVVLYSLYLLFSGHNAPGGGFAAGLVAGLALAMRYLAGGREELRAAAPLPPGLLLGIGLFLSAGVGLGALVFEGNVLQSWIIPLHVPLIGTVKLVTSLFFDVGVYLVVIGLMIDVLRTLGSGLDVQMEESR